MTETGDEIMRRIEALEKRKELDKSKHPNIISIMLGYGVGIAMLAGSFAALDILIFVLGIVLITISTLLAYLTISRE